MAHDQNTGFSPVVLAPTYNNARTLEDVLRRIISLGLELIVVNDGSCDGTDDVLRRLFSSCDNRGVTVVAHDRNRGKAAALKTGFAVARAAGHSHAATIDTDGQHDPDELRKLIDAARRCPEALVLGRRSQNVAGCPGVNRAGWLMSGAGIWLETGLRVPDSQCGLRVYPLSLLEQTACRAGRFGFEPEIISRAAWRGVPLVEVPVTCHYFPGELRVSHFRPWRDGARSFLMRARLTLRRLVPWPILAARHSGGTPHRIGQQIALRFDPRVLWASLRRDRLEHAITACAMGIGAFFAAFPLGGWQIAAALYAMWRLHVHAIPVLLGVLTCLTPWGEFLTGTSMSLGGMLLRLELPERWGGTLRLAEQWGAFTDDPFAAVLGGTIVGFANTWVTIGLAMLVFRAIPLRAEAEA